MRILRFEAIVLSVLLAGCSYAERPQNSSAEVVSSRVQILYARGGGMWVVGDGHLSAPIGVRWEEPSLVSPIVDPSESDQRVGCAAFGWTGTVDGRISGANDGERLMLSKVTDVSKLSEGQLAGLRQVFDFPVLEGQIC